VVGNANRLRRYHPAPLPEPGAVQTEPHVETSGRRAREDETGTTGPMTDPVCGMTVDPATAAAHRGAGPGTVYFCSAHCAAAFDTDPGRYAPAAGTAPGAAAR
jgi:Cu+-exporting ATPase